MTILTKKKNVSRNKSKSKTKLRSKSKAKTSKMKGGDNYVKLNLESSTNVVPKRRFNGTRKGISTFVKGVKDLFSRKPVANIPSNIKSLKGFESSSNPFGSSSSNSRSDPFGHVKRRNPLFNNSEEVVPDASVTSVASVASIMPEVPPVMRKPYNGPVRAYLGQAPIPYKRYFNPDIIRTYSSQNVRIASTHNNNEGDIKMYNGTTRPVAPPNPNTFVNTHMYDPKMPDVQTYTGFRNLRQ